MRTRATLLAALLVVAPGMAVAAAPQASLVAACASCHRLDGRDAALPPIVGLEASRIEALMLAYRGASQGSQIMRVIAGALSPEEIAAIARDLAARPAPERQP